MTYRSLLQIPGRQPRRRTEGALVSFLTVTPSPTILTPRRSSIALPQGSSSLHHATGGVARRVISCRLHPPAFSHLLGLRAGECVPGHKSHRSPPTPAPSSGSGAIRQAHNTSGANGCPPRLSSDGAFRIRSSREVPMARALYGPSECEVPLGDVRESPPSVWST